jgi:hypothetical protein
VLVMVGVGCAENFDALFGDGGVATSSPCSENGACLMSCTGGCICTDANTCAVRCTGGPCEVLCNGLNGCNVACPPNVQCRIRCPYVMQGQCTARCEGEGGPPFQCYSTDVGAASFCNWTNPPCEH